MDGTEYITLKEAGEISGYSPDYIGQLIRRGKLTGKQVYANVAWVTTRDALDGYLEEKGKSKKIDYKDTRDEEGEETGLVPDEVTPPFSPAVTAPQLIEQTNARVDVSADIPELQQWERLLRVLSLSVIVCASLFLVLLFHVLSTAIDDQMERRALEGVSGLSPSHHL